MFDGCVRRSSGQGVRLRPNLDALRPNLDGFRPNRSGFWRSQEDGSRRRGGGDRIHRGLGDLLTSVSSAFGIPALFGLVSLVGLGALFGILAATTEAYAQVDAILPGGAANPEGGNDGAGNDGAAGLTGWSVDEMTTFFAIIAGAIFSGAVLAYHPHYRNRLGSLEEMDLPKIFITYTVVGAVVGHVVVQQQALGLAIFGLGGLMRFRTLLPTAKETGRLILSTMIGVAWGIEAWGMAVAVTVLGWLLVLVLDWGVAYRIIVRGLENVDLTAVSEAYRGALSRMSARVANVKKNPKKSQVSIVFKASRKQSREDFEVAFDEDVPAELRGTVDWSEEA